MGNDGGSIPTRRELVKEAARNPTTQQLKEAREERQDHVWNVDPLSQRPLARPVVSDALGRLFGKESVLEYLLPSEDAAVVARQAEQREYLQGHVGALRDVVEVRFEAAAPADAAARVGGVRRDERWLCPITGQELGPGSKAVYVVPCGHAFAGAAIREVSGEGCLVCGKPYAANDVIPILPTDEADTARLSLRAKTLREKGLAHSLKPLEGGKKRKKKGVEAAPKLVAAATDDGDTAVAGVATAVESSPDKLAPDSRRATLTKPSAPSAAPQPQPLRASDGIKNASTASLTKKVLEEQEERAKRRRVDRNDNLDSLFSKAGDASKKGPSDISFMNRGFSIPNRR